MTDLVLAPSGEELDRTVDPRSTPLLNDENRFKLALFGANVSSGCAITRAPGTIRVDWAESRRLALAADAAGIDAMIPVARWKGLGGSTNFNDRCFETFTWAAGVAAITNRIQPLATVHVPTIHPVRVAKEAATVDHISGGRFALNLVVGWNGPEFAMFGVEQADHDDRYEVGAEWVQLVRRLWTEDTFTHHGKHFSGVDMHSSPAPMQAPGPAIMSAGASPTGRRFAAAHADISFIQGGDLTAHREKARAIREAADAEGRHIKVMGMGYVVCADTETEARRYLEHYVDQLGDWEAAANVVALAQGKHPGTGPEARAMMRNLVAGYTALPLVGTPEQVVQGLLDMEAHGLDGCTLTWVDYEKGLTQYREQLLPLLVDVGLRARPERLSGIG